MLMGNALAPPPPSFPMQVGFLSCIWDRGRGCIPINLVHYAGSKVVLKLLFGATWIHPNHRSLIPTKLKAIGKDFLSRGRVGCAHPVTPNSSYSYLPGGGGRGAVWQCCTAGKGWISAQQQPHLKRGLKRTVQAEIASWVLTGHAPGPGSRIPGVLFLWQLKYRSWGWSAPVWPKSPVYETNSSWALLPVGSSRQGVVFNGSSLLLI